MVPVETQTMSIRLPEELYERLRLEAFKKRVSMASIIVGALEERFERIDQGDEGYLTAEASTASKESRNGTQGQ